MTLNVHACAGRAPSAATTSTASAIICARNKSCQRMFSPGCLRSLWRQLVNCAVAVLATSVGCSEQVPGGGHDHAFRIFAVRALGFRAKGVKHVESPIVRIYDAST